MELTPFFFGLYKFVKYGLYPLTWVVLLLGIATVLALFPFSPTRLRWVRKLLLSTLLLLVALSSPLIATPLIGLLESWHHPRSWRQRIVSTPLSCWEEALTRKARFDQPPNPLPIPETEPPAE